MGDIPDEDILWVLASSSVQVLLMQGGFLCVDCGLTRSADTLARLGGDEFGMILADCPIERRIEIAESVETAALLKLLREIGVDYAQRYHFARPMPLDDYPGLQRLSQAGLPATKASGK